MVDGFVLWVRRRKSDNESHLLHPLDLLQSVVLFIDLCHCKVEDGPDLQLRRAELREALDLFKYVKNNITVVDHSLY